MVSPIAWQLIIRIFFFFSLCLLPYNFFTLLAINLSVYLSYINRLKIDYLTHYALDHISFLPISH